MERKVMTTEKITVAAILLGGMYASVPSNTWHHKVYSIINSIQETRSWWPDFYKKGENLAGWLTDEGRFVFREEAMEIARNAKQDVKYDSKYVPNVKYESKYETELHSVFDHEVHLNKNDAKMERVVSVALRTNGLTISMVKPHRHHDILHKCNPQPEILEQGFLTNTGRFVDRKEGWDIFMKEKSFVIHPTLNRGVLYSEDLF
jgi:hypothetical protein